MTAWFESVRAIFDVKPFHSDVVPKAKPLSPELGEGGVVKIGGWADGWFGWLIGTVAVEQKRCRRMVISWKINATLGYIRYQSEKAVFSSTS